MDALGKANKRHLIEVFYLQQTSIYRRKFVGLGDGRLVGVGVGGVN